MTHQNEKTLIQKRVFFKKDRYIFRPRSSLLTLKLLLSELLPFLLRFAFFLLFLYLRGFHADYIEKPPDIYRVMRK